MKEGHNAVSEPFGDAAQQFANSENDVDEYICKKSMK
jgi:hypothetical protein